MESIPLINTVNAPRATSVTQVDASNVSSRPIPAEVLVSADGDSIILNGTEYNLKLVNTQQRQALITASHFLVAQTATTATQAATIHANQTAQLLALGTSLTLKLPEAITQLAQQNGVTLEQLHGLAGRAQGYPLPNVIVINKEFQFANGTVIQQDPKTQLSAGEYQAKIALSQGRPILVLTPILSKLEILIGAPINETQIPIIDKQAANVVIAKTEPAQIIATFLRKLEGLVPQTEGASTTGVIAKTTAAGALASGAAVAQSIATNLSGPNLDSTSATAKGSLTLGQISIDAGQASLAKSTLGQLPAGTELKLTTHSIDGKAVTPADAVSNNPLTTNSVLAKSAAPNSVQNPATSASLQAGLFQNTPHQEIGSRAPDKTQLQPIAQAPGAHSTNPATSANSASVQQQVVQQMENGLTPKLSDTAAQLPPLQSLTPLEGQVSDQKGNKSAEAGISVNEVLQKAFSKAGALPLDQLTLRNHLNLAAELLKRLPQLSPQPLSQLSIPEALKADLLGLATLNLATPQLNQAALFINASAISSLFQLLLGVRANSTNNVVSQKLANYLEQLQAKTGLSTNLLNQLSKAGGLETMGQLASSLHLYQQASSENNGNLVWYFALPYGINQRHEQLEGKFEQDADKDKQQKQKGWHLQLKFNLTQGPLLISARCHLQTLDIQFKGNNQQLLNRVDNFLLPLGQKLSQIGFTPGELSTQIAQVPATLLPGDHFLVKTKA
ncbi:flagellar hook-length control protein FliK [Shewanella putrefaciens]|uniref:flagellar hook-length control protein FliK n=1 Tax=Shewanella putrefaciens TaxID=24 RepID=UPI0018E8DEAF|nr:flagellar hook-length control protein FliK [Shewanella putrefaciens]